MVCGPTKYDRFIPDFHFSKCCQIHDDDYDRIAVLGKRLYDIRIKTSFDLSVRGFILDQIECILASHQKQADNRFLINMLTRNLSCTNKFKKKLYDFVAYIYYFAVKQQGINIIMDEVIK